jgi:hypothetical protein
MSDHGTTSAVPPEEEPGAEEPERGAEEQEDQAQQQSETQQRYNLRSRRAQPGRWATKTSKKEYGLHITATKALKSHGREAISAMLMEIQQMISKNVFKPVNVNNLTAEERKSIIITSMFLKEKHKPDGSFDKLKARLVAGGHMQDRTIYDDISSPTVSWTSVCIVLAIAAEEERKVCTADFTGAYLNASMKDSNVKVRVRLNQLQSTLLVSLDQRFAEHICKDGTIVVELLKAMYGCIESALLWYEALRDTLVSIGMIVNSEDQCVFNMTKYGVQCTIAVYVDDLLVTCKQQSLIDEILSKVKSKYPDVKVTSGAQHSYLGVSIDFSTRKKVKLTMDGYTRDVLQLYGVSSKARTPATELLFEVRESPALPESKRMEFHSRVAKLLYLARRVRPDLLTAVGFLTTRVQKPTEDDWSKLQRCLGYLNFEPSLGITLECTNGINPSGMYDAAYGVHVDGKSQSGSTHTLGKGPISARSRKQKLVAKSSTEAELISASDNVPELIGIRRFLVSQGYALSASTIYQDNMSTMALIAKGRSTSEGSKHIKIRYFFVKQYVDDGELQVVHMPTDDMLADLLTKPLQGTKFRELRNRVMNIVE